MAQLGDLIVSGKSRFLNKISGACTNGTTVSSQSQTTKFLREDGEWAAPSYTTNTDKYVNQQNETTDSSYNIIFSGQTANNNNYIDVVKKSTYLQFNPSKPALTVGTRSSGTVGAYSFTAGQNNIASSSQSIAVGYGNTASADQAFVCGNGNTASGNYSHAEGKGCTASGWYTHAEGQSTTASSDAAHAEGCTTQASGSYSHAEGYSSKALSNYSHAEGYGCEASTGAWYQHAEGQACTAKGDAAHAEGCYTTTVGNYSHSSGLQTYASSKSQFVFGEYNEIDGSDNKNGRNTYVEIVGNGTADKRSDARRLSWTGDEWLAGGLTVGGSVTFASGTWNNIGDDIKFGDIDWAGTVAFKGISGDTTVRLNEKDNDKKYIQLKLNSSEGNAYIQTSQKLRIKSDGDIEFFTDGSVTTYNKAGSGYKSMRASAFTVMSSKLVKSNIKDITKEKAEKILELRPVTFDMWHGENNQSGMIAEEVLKVLPELVIVPENYNEEEAKAKIENDELVDVPSLDYTKFVPYLIKMIQEQQKEIDELKSIIND